MIYLRLMVSFLLVGLGAYLSFENVKLAFNSNFPDEFRLYGIHNILAGIACLFIGLYMVLYWINTVKTFPFSLGNINKVGFMLIVGSLLIALLLKSMIQSNIEKNGYVECSDLSKIATRYTSKTYTKTPEICAQLVANK